MEEEVELGFTITKTPLNTKGGKGTLAQMEQMRRLAEAGELVWCNVHNRLAKRCKSEGGIMIPCRRVNLSEHFEIEDDGKEGITILSY